jgi:hypothetical protein
MSAKLFAYRVLQNIGVRIQAGTKILNLHITPKLRQNFRQNLFQLKLKSPARYQNISHNFLLKNNI